MTGVSGPDIWPECLKKPKLANVGLPEVGHGPWFKPKVWIQVLGLRWFQGRGSRVDGCGLRVRGSGTVFFGGFSFFGEVQFFRWFKWSTHTQPHTQHNTHYTHNTQGPSAFCLARARIWEIFGGPQSQSLTDRVRPFNECVPCWNGPSCHWLAVESCLFNHGGEEGHPPRTGGTMETKVYALRVDHLEQEILLRALWSTTLLKVTRTGWST